MENLHLKNLTKTDIVTATLRYVAAIQRKNKKNEQIYEKQINDYFTLPKQFDIKNEFHLANIFHHITTLIKLINLNRNYYNNNIELALRKEIYKYFKNIKEYENRIVPQVEEIHKQPTNSKQLEEIEIAYANYMYVDKSFVPEIKQIIDILNIYAKHNNKTKEDIIKIYKECCGYYNKHTVGTGVVGCDNGVSTLAYVSDKKLELVDLVPEECLRIEEGINRLNKQISRKLRLLNPDCYDENNKVVKGKKMTNRSNNLTKLMNRVQKKQHKMRIYRNELQNKVCNELLSQGNVIQLEKMNVKALQKRSKNVRINPKTNRPYSKKRFGKSILKAAPSSLVTLLKNKAASRGATVIEINTRDTKPSQFNHILNDNLKKILNVRIYDLSDDHPNVQRDLYSAILNKYTIQHTKNNKVTYEIDKTRLTNEFEQYYKLMQNEITKIRNENKRLSWYVS